MNTCIFCATFFFFFKPGIQREWQKNWVLSCLISSHTLLLETYFQLFCFVLLLSSLLRSIISCQWFLTLSIFQNALFPLIRFDVSSLGYLSQVCDDPLRLCNSYRFLPEYIYSLAVCYSYGRDDLVFQAFITIQTFFSFWDEMPHSYSWLRTELVLQRLEENPISHFLRTKYSNKCKWIFYNIHIDMQCFSNLFFPCCKTEPETYMYFFRKGKKPARLMLIF